MIIRLTHLIQIYTVLSKLENCADSLFTWFKENHMKPNGDKCQFLVTTKKSLSVNIDGSNVKSKKEQNFLGIKFDSSVSRVSLCENACQKLHALATIINYIDLPKRKVLIKAFITLWSINLDVT